MRPFTYTSAADPQAAVQAAAGPAGSSRSESHVRSPVQYLGGGTTLVDLMKLDVMRPTQLVDISRIDNPRMRAIEATGQGLRIGSLATMRQVADHPVVRRDYPVLSESLWLAASQQLRNMAFVGGNVLQRTRCAIFATPAGPATSAIPEPAVRHWRA